MNVEFTKAIYGLTLMKDEKELGTIIGYRYRERTSPIIYVVTSTGLIETWDTNDKHIKEVAILKSRLLKQQNNEETSRFDIMDL
jgi:hypothetical protein